MTRPVWPCALALAAAPVAWAHGQVAAPERAAVSAGVESRMFRFGDQLGVRSLWQVATPVTFLTAHRRLTLDVGTWYAVTSVERRDRSRTTVAGLTDAQVRGTYVVGSDALVLTAVVNLPTGADNLSPAEYSVLAAASSSFLAFPVNAHASGLSATAGAAGAMGAGAWNLGLAASLRVSRGFSPFDDPAAGPFTYRAGPEARIRAAADRLAGQGRLAFALTYSTFSTDEYGTSAGTIGLYRPGPRVIGEGFYTTPLGRSIATVYVWDFFRTSGDSAGTSARNRENLLAGGLAVRIPLSPTVSLEPAVEGRWSRPTEGQAFLMEFRAAARVRLARGSALVPTVRFGFGRLEEPAPGIGHAILGAGLSVFLRKSL